MSYLRCRPVQPHRIKERTDSDFSMGKRTDRPLRGCPRPIRQNGSDSYPQKKRNKNSSFQMKKIFIVLFYLRKADISFPPRLSECTEYSTERRACQPSEHELHQQHIAHRPPGDGEEHLPLPDVETGDDQQGNKLRQTAAAA